MSQNDIEVAYQTIIECQQSVIESLQAIIEAQSETIAQFMGIQTQPQVKKREK